MTEFKNGLVKIQINPKLYTIDLFQKSPISQLCSPAIKLNLRPNLFLLFLYLSDSILNLLSRAKVFSTVILLLLSSWLNSFCPKVRGVFLLFLWGIIAFVFIFCIPWYPVSPSMFVFLVKVILDSLNILKSCFLPLEKLVLSIFLLLCFIKICTFMVCAFFFPE